MTRTTRLPGRKIRRLAVLALAGSAALAAAAPAAELVESVVARVDDAIITESQLAHRVERARETGLPRGIDGGARGGKLRGAGNGHQAEIHTSHGG